MISPSDGEEALASPSRFSAGQVPAPRLARLVTSITLVCYGSIMVINVLALKGDTRQFWTTMACVVVMMTAQFLHSARGARDWPLWGKIVTLSLQTISTVVPSVMFGQAWGVMWGFLAGSALILVSGRTGFALGAVAMAVSCVFSLKVAQDWTYAFYYIESTLLAALVVYGITKLADLVDEVHASRAQLARMAVTQERLRFSRDLHDLLGYSLSAVTLKGELIHRLILARPGQAREETTQLLDVARQALADVRMVASGYRDMSLRDEATAAAEILESADIQTEVDVDCGRLHPLVDTVLATALREGVTNVLRHSKVQTCMITAVADGETVRLLLVNDGVGQPDEQVPALHSGSGLTNLRTRTEAIGGRLEAGVHADGRFHLQITTPLRPAGTDTTARGGTVVGLNPAAA